MTEHLRYDELDRAIDAVISQGDLTPTGDADLDALARLASGLRGLPSPEFKARLRAELVPPRVRRPWLSFLRRNAMTVLLQQIIERPRLVAPLAFATAAAVAAVIAVLVISPFDRGGRAPEQVTQLPDEAFGVLPESRPDGKGGGGVTIPGSSGAIAYTLSPDLSLPTSALAYRLRLPEITPERVQGIARRLGFTEVVQPITGDKEGTVVGYQVASAPACPADLAPPAPGTSEEEYEAKHCGEPARVLQMFPLDGSIFYNDSTAAATASAPREERAIAEARATASAPREEQAIAAARDWLVLTGLADSDTVVRSLEPGDPMCSAGCWQVVADFVPQLPYLPGPGRPRISIIVNGQGIVTHADGSWAATDAQSIYPLHTADELLTNLRNLRGEFDFLFAAPVGGKNQPPPPPVSPDTFRDASATVESVEVVYARGVAASGQVYLTPVYIVRVNLTQAGLAEPFPFATWVPATGPTAGPPQVPPELAELMAVRDTLPLPAGATIRWSFPVTGFAEPALTDLAALFGLQTGYFVQDTPEGVAEFYRRELAALGWQQEATPTIRQELRELLPGGFTSFASFKKDDLRLVILVGPNQKDESLGGTLLHVSVERRGPLAEVSDTLNIRSQPTSESQVVGVLKRGERVELLEQVEGQEAEPGSGNTTWHRIAQGYIYSAYVTKP